jgi:hypothetical protein
MPRTAQVDAVDNFHSKTNIAEKYIKPSYYSPCIRIYSQPTKPKKYTSEELKIQEQELQAQKLKSEQELQAKILKAEQDFVRSQKFDDSLKVDYSQQGVKRRIEELCNACDRAILFCRC